MATARLMALVTQLVATVKPLTNQGGNELSVRLDTLLQAAQQEAAQVDNTVPRQIAALEAQLTGLQAQITALTTPAPPAGDSHG